MNDSMAVLRRGRSLKMDWPRLDWKVGVRVGLGLGAHDGLPVVRLRSVWSEWIGEGEWQVW